MFLAPQLSKFLRIGMTGVFYLYTFLFHMSSAHLKPQCLRNVNRLSRSYVYPRRANAIRPYEQPVYYNWTMTGLPHEIGFLFHRGHDPSEIWMDFTGQSCHYHYLSIEKILLYVQNDRGVLLFCIFILGSADWEPQCPRIKNLRLSVTTASSVCCFLVPAMAHGLRPVPPLF